jgi:hypothetical protein
MDTRMSSFKNFLVEYTKNKKYAFKVGIAGKLPEGFDDTLETALKKFDVTNITPPKRTPIQERPLDFPQLQNMEVTYYEVELNYPTTPQIMTEYLNVVCGVSKGHVIVRTFNDPANEYQEKNKETPYETLLNKEDMGGPSAQNVVGQNRVMDLLKELEIARADRGTDPGCGGPAEAPAKIIVSHNNKGPIGS